MAKNSLSQFLTRRTPQREAIPGASQVLNHAGGFVFAVDEWTRLRRFLILGVDGPTYYASEVRENAEVLLACIALDGERTVDEIVAISVAGRTQSSSRLCLPLRHVLLRKILKRAPMH
jgi:60 kDa SS-A/Ro ribonucleoprotein